MASWYNPPAFVPIKHIPSTKKDDLRGKEIISLHAVAHGQLSGPYHSGFTNHWCIYYQTGENESICINVQPNPQQEGKVIAGGHKADVIVSLLPFVTPPDSTRKNKVATKPGLNIGNVIDLLEQHGREKYEFTAGNVGCRKWTTDFLILLGEQGWADVSAIRATQGDIRRLWPQGVELELDDGQYYE